MNKSPIEYFREQDFTISTTGKDFSPAEQAFIEKYLGVEGAPSLVDLGHSQNAAAAEKTPDLHKGMGTEQPLIQVMRESEDLQMVAFYLGNQEFTLPTIVVQEVIRTMPISKLPSAPPLIAGAVSLRGKITPLIRLRSALEVHSPRKQEDRFIIVCRRQGFQVGLLIERVHTMYRIPRADIEWNIESTLGAGVEFISGLVKLNNMLVGIVDVDKIIQSILE